jgi:hypothetical protein
METNNCVICMESLGDNGHPACPACDIKLHSGCMIDYLNSGLLTCPHCRNPAAKVTLFATFLAMASTAEMQKALETGLLETLRELRRLDALPMIIEGVQKAFPAYTPGTPVRNQVNLVNLVILVNQVRVNQKN